MSPVHQLFPGTAIAQNVFRTENCMILLVKGNRFRCNYLRQLIKQPAPLRFIAAMGSLQSIARCRMMRGTPVFQAQYSFLFCAVRVWRQ